MKQLGTYLIKNLSLQPASGGGVTVYPFQLVEELWSGGIYLQTILVTLRRQGRLVVSNEASAVILPRLQSLSTT